MKHPVYLVCKYPKQAPSYSTNCRSQTFSTLIHVFHLNFETFYLNSLQNCQTETKNGNKRKTKTINMNNKHYLKHAILVLLTVFFSKLQATDYYWVGGTNDYAVDGRCWNTSSTATPSTSTGRLATGSTINSTMIKDVNTAFSALTTSGTPANTFNFNNKLNINLAGAILTSNTVFLNTSSGSNNINLNLNPGGTTIGSTLTFSGEPTFTSTRHIFNFKSSTSTTKVVFSQIGGAQVIYPGKYHNVEFGSAGATSSKIINSGDNVEIQNNLNLYKNLAINGTLTLGSNMTFT